MQDNNSNKLVSTGKSNLAKAREGLAERGLELIAELKGRDLKIAYADYDDGAVADIFHEMVLLFSNNRFNIIKKWSHFGEKLLDFAQSGTVDIFILNLNCITNSDKTFNVYERLEYSLSIITQIKRAAPKAIIIAYSGFAEEVSQKAEKAGANFYLPLPAKFEAFKKIFEKCVETIFGDRLLI